MQTKMCMLANGKTIKHMAKVPTITQTVLSMKVSGKKTSNTVMELRSGETEPNTRVNTSTE